MGIDGVTSARASATAGLLQSMLRQLEARGVSSAKPKFAEITSATGPAYLLGDSGDDTTPSLSRTLESILSAQRAQANAANPAPTSQSQKQRTAALKSAADKIDTGDAEGGRAVAQRLLDKAPKDVAALRLVASSHIAEGDYKRAQRLYTRGLTLHPTDARLKGDLEDVRTLQKSDEEVLAIARRKLTDRTERPRGLRLLAHLAKRSPEDAEAHLALAEGFRAAGMPRQAIAALQEAVKHATGGESTRVINQARKLVDEYPDIGLTNNILGRALQDTGRLDDAIAELKAAVNVAPYDVGYVKDLAGAYVTRAETKLAAGNSASAESDLQAARRIDPANERMNEITARVALDRARGDISHGFYKSALGKLNTAAAKAPDDTKFKKEVASLYIRAAVHFQNRDDEAVALTAYIKAHELDPTSAIAERKVAELSHQRGLTALSTMDYDLAIAHFERAYQTHRVDTAFITDLANAYDLRGQQLLARGKMDDALEDFERGLAVDPTNSSLGESFSSAYLQKYGA